jgi:hypothetical protein
MSTRCPVPAVETDSNSTDSNDVSRCIGGTVGVEKISINGPCNATCKNYTDEKGCKVMVCNGEEKKVICPTSVCKEQDYDHLKSEKEKCALRGAKLVMVNDEGSCPIYKCELDVNAGKICIKDIPQEKINYCEARGGKYLTKYDAQGCIAVAQCIRQGSPEIRSASTEAQQLNQSVITDKAKLLNLAVKLEALRVELQKTADKTSKIAEYYTAQGKTADANRMKEATVQLLLAVDKIDSVKSTIKNNVSNFSESQAKEVIQTISTITDEILGKVLLAILG